MTNTPEYYRRNMPHIQPKNGVFNIVIRLNGTLPYKKLKALKDARELRILELKQAQLTEQVLRQTLAKEAMLYFGKFDALLDKGGFGPTHLKEEKIAQIVYDSLLYWNEQARYQLICFCIMPNHLHLIIHKIQRPLFRILGTIKTFTSTKANEVLGNAGKAFWQKESYDNLVRDRLDLKQKMIYILENPVKAGFVNHWNSWRWTYLTPEYKHLITHP